MHKQMLNLLAGIFVVALATPLLAAETITGEVISLSCYTNDKSEIGSKGRTCALATIKWEGNPAGILTSDGKVYQITGGLAANNNEKLWALIGHTVTITGETTMRPGLTTLISASDAKDVSPAK